MISFVIPCYNYWHVVQEAIDSINNQTVKVPYEIIVIDDASKHLGMVVGLVDVVVWLGENRGLSAARNLGTQIARGEWVTWIDADDTITPNYLEVMLPYLTVRHEIVHPSTRGPINYAEILENNWVCGAGTLMRKETALQYPFIDPAPPEKGMEDWYLWCRLAKDGVEQVCVPDHLYNWRRHEGSMSRKWEGTATFEWMKQRMWERLGYKKAEAK